MVEHMSYTRTFTKLPFRNTFLLLRTALHSLRDRYRLLGSGSRAGSRGAAHAARATGEDATPEELEILGAVKYQDNLCVLHDDASYMPKVCRACVPIFYLLSVPAGKRGTGGARQSRTAAKHTAAMRTRLVVQGLIVVRYTTVTGRIAEDLCIRDAPVCTAGVRGRSRAVAAEPVIVY